MTPALTRLLASSILIERGTGTFTRTERAKTGPEFTLTAEKLLRKTERDCGLYPADCQSSIGMYVCLKRRRSKTYWEDLLIERDLSWSKFRRNETNCDIERIALYA